MANSIRTYASHNLVVIHWLEGMQRAFDTMTTASIRHLPVVDDSGGIVGILSDRDLQRAMQIEQPDFNSGKIAQPSYDPGARVRDHMSWPVRTIGEGCTLMEAAREMLDKRISSLLVTKNSHVVGIVTTDDLLRALIDGSNSEGRLQELADEARAAIYRSPVGQIAHALANAGI